MERSDEATARSPDRRRQHRSEVGRCDLRGDRDAGRGERSPNLRGFLWTASSRLGEELAGLAVIPNQQFAYTKGKNSSDITLVIDAMDLMHTGRFEGFVLVSSDSDFARLASRLREQGLQVFGIGKTNTPEAFRKACKRFIFVENLLGDGEALPEIEDRTRTEPAGSKPEGKEPIAQSGQRATQREAPPSGPEKTDSAETIRKQPATKAVPLVIAAMRAHDDDWVSLSVIGSHVRAANPEFDPRSYGVCEIGKTCSRRRASSRSSGTKCRFGRGGSGCNRSLVPSFLLR